MTKLEKSSKPKLRLVPGTKPKSTGSSTKSAGLRATSGAKAKYRAKPAAMARSTDSASGRLKDLKKAKSTLTQKQKSIFVAIIQWLLPRPPKPRLVGKAKRKVRHKDFHQFFSNRR